MATVAGLQRWNTKRVSLTTWGPLLTTDVGSAENCGRFNNHTVQIVGTVGAGGSVNIQGSNDGVNWASLSTHTGASLATAAPGVYTIWEPVIFIRPSVVAGDGTTSLTVTLAVETV